ncbi:hypothetical protein F511_23792 [Dorcoceras hygrometricum]|uniref:Uncharacterized protein n=1 Tax=Dorcoceras hygrometricum TaxID=472368 RepID=A0A2Z7AK93_9LAMI|nr:hypothetical protein F511_23792 [Dorcoceras hygrometricum]
MAAPLPARLCASGRALDTQWLDKIGCWFRTQVVRSADDRCMMDARAVRSSLRNWLRKPLKVARRREQLTDWWQTQAAVLRTVAPLAGATTGRRSPAGRATLRAAVRRAWRDVVRLPPRDFVAAVVAGGRHPTMLRRCHDG